MAIPSEVRRVQAAIDNHSQKELEWSLWYARMRQSVPSARPADVKYWSAVEQQVAGDPHILLQPRRSILCGGRRPPIVGLGSVHFQASLQAMSRLDGLNALGKAIRQSSRISLGASALEVGIMASAMASIVALKDVHQQLKTRMEKTVDDFRANLLSARTGRASVHMLDMVKVDYYGSDVPVSQVAQITTPEAQLILVQPWEQSLVTAIEKAIRTSGQGFNPMHDGRIIRVPIPPMNEERRKEAVEEPCGRARRA